MKTIMDAVHGQVRVPKKFCSQIIDTLLFQRLKRVEQTFASSIFPTATHNRFMHSVGVFYIGCRLFNAIEKNSNAESIRGTLNAGRVSKYILRRADCSSIPFYEILKESYYVACLLHDCGHAPFSHTFENFYLLPDPATVNEHKGKLYLTGITNDIVAQCGELSHIFGDSERENLVTSFIEDLKKAQSKDCARIKAHEYVSSWLVLHKKGFLKNITSMELYADPLLVCRMIMGIPFDVTTTEIRDDDLKTRQILNCYISLLNGNSIDADRIDYAARDQWAMGVNSSVLNLNRLLSAIHIDRVPEKKSVEVVYSKQALTELRSLSKTKNYSAYWVFNHHKFKLLEDSLIRAVRYLAIYINPHDRKKYEKSLERLHAAISRGEQTSQIIAEMDVMGNQALRTLFDYHSYIDAITIGKERITQPCDDDIFSMLKRISTVEETGKKYSVVRLMRDSYNEWFSRDSSYVTVWKSYSEYLHIFKNKLADKILSLYDGKPEKELVEASLAYRDANGLALYKKLFEIVLENVFQKAASKKTIRMIDLSRVSFRNSNARCWVKFHESFICSDALFLPDSAEGAECEPFFYLYVKKKLMLDINDSATSSAIANHILRGINQLRFEQVDDIVCPRECESDSLATPSLSQGDGIAV